MVQDRIFDEPSLSLAVPVYFCAAVIFPFQLGWSGASVLGLFAYLAFAAVLFTFADAFWQRSFYPTWHSFIPQTVLCAFALGPPAALAFLVGTALEPMEEALDEKICAAQGADESDHALAEVDDIFDMSADCLDPR